MLQPLHLHAGCALRDDEGLDGRAAEVLVEGGPDDDVVGAVTGGDEDLLAVEDVVVAVLDRGGADLGGVGAELRLGDRHPGPDTVEALELLVVGDRGDRGVAEPLARHREQQPDVAPAHLGDRHDRSEVGAVLDRGVAVVLVPSDAGGARTLARPGLREAVDHGGEHVELLGVLVLRQVVLARDRPQHVHRDLVGLADQGLELLGVFEVDHGFRVPFGGFRGRSEAGGAKSS